MPIAEVAVRPGFLLKKFGDRSQRSKIMKTEEVRSKTNNEIFYHAIQSQFRLQAMREAYEFGFS